ncbi:MAG: peptidylprolyl isomerase [Acidobacteriota bacterium]|jgi:peptidyl-prolyl cis-trans isomerase A (cyclophilin A)
MHWIKKSFWAILSLLCAIVLGLGNEQAAVQSNIDKLMNPAGLNEKAPDVYQAKFNTTKGGFVIQVRRAWAPNGADRFYNLVKNGYYDNCRFFRMVPESIVQFGITGDPRLNAIWSQAKIQDDPVKQSNRKGYVSFASSGKNSRTTQVFINFTDDNILFDGLGFAPFGTVVKGTDVVSSFYGDYGDGPPAGKYGPEQNRVQTEGNAYLDKNFPKLDYIKTAVILSEGKK